MFFTNEDYATSRTKNSQHWCKKLLQQRAREIYKESLELIEQNEQEDNL